MDTKIHNIFLVLKSYLEYPNNIVINMFCMYKHANTGLFLKKVLISNIRQMKIEEFIEFFESSCWIDGAYSLHSDAINTQQNDFIGFELRFLKENDTCLGTSKEFFLSSLKELVEDDKTSLSIKQELLKEYSKYENY